MEKRLLEKLLYDKRRELEAYDKQLEEYMRLSTQRAAAGSQPLVPTGRRVIAQSPAAAAALSAPSASLSQKEVLQKLLAEKKQELDAANAEVSAYTAALAEKTQYTAPAVVPAAPGANMEERVRALEALLASELQRKEEAVSLNEELLRINEEQVKTNEELVRKLQAAAAFAAAAAAAVPAAAANAMPTTTLYRFGDTPTPTPAPMPTPTPAKQQLELVQSADGSEAAYQNLGRVLESPSGLGVLALGLASALGPTLSNAANAVSDAVSETRVIGGKRGPKV